MKTPSSRRARGFTLVELLVVIAIIAVLAGLSTSAALSAIQKAKKTTCLATCVALESAVNNFFTEYGSMPTTSTSTADIAVKTDNGGTGKDLLTILLGLETVTNTRAVRFLTVKEGKANKNGSNPKNGLIFADATTVKGLYDPWGGGYNVIMDLDFNEQLSVKPKAAAAAVPLNGRRCAVWSDGADGVTATGKITDDVKTW